MGIYPSQLRTVDPYASYHSNVVNKLTRLVTRGTNCIHSKYAVDVVLDTTSDHEIIVSAGECFKDDVLIELTAQHNLDIRDTSNYAPGAVVGAGTWYVVLDYTYSKSRPAPQASIKLLTTNVIANISSGPYLFLKALTVTVPGAGATITALHDIDPTTPTPLYQPYARRNFTQLYIGLEFTLPSFTQLTDESRVIYVQDEDEVYYGTSTHWEPLGAVRAAIDTTLCGVYATCYVDGTGNLQLAIATDYDTLAECVVTSYGASDGAGMVRIVGPVTAELESGLSVWPAVVNVGDKLYLSRNEAGKLTNVEPSPISQYVGPCVTGPTSLDPNLVNLWFVPSGLNSTVNGGGFGNANSFEYIFSSSIVDGDPGIGHLRFNNAAPGATTQLFVDLQTIEPGNPNINPWLLTLDDSDSTIRGHIRISRLNHPEVFAIFAITNDTASAVGYKKFLVTYVDGNGTFINNDYVVFSYSRTGDKGETGNSAVYIHNQIAPAFNWTIVHNLGEQYCTVEVIDNNDQTVIPSDITFDDNTSLTITFIVATSGHAVVVTAGGSQVVGGISHIVQDTAPQLGGDLDLNLHNINYTDILTANGTYEGEIINMFVDDPNTVFGDVLAQTIGFDFERAYADGTSNPPSVVMALEAGKGLKKVLLKGQICSTLWSWSPGLLYVDVQPNDGEMTQTQPNVSGDHVQIVGFALSPTTVFFNPQYGTITIK
jgi:hypothetical protein